MPTYLRAPEAARRLGVTTATLYSYVSRGRVGRTLGSDGRSSLFDLAEIDSLIAASSRPVPPPPTIDVRISTSIVRLDESGLRYRGLLVDDLVDEPFERVCNLLWHGTLDDLPIPLEATAPREDIDTGPLDVMSMIRLATDIDPALDPVAAATELLGVVTQDGAGCAARIGDRTDTPHRASPSFAERLLRRFTCDASPDLVAAVNTALVLLADHGLATSTLAVRVATSVRASPPGALIAGLATVDGDLHGSASWHSHRLFEQVEAEGARRVLTGFERDRRRVPGFGHKIYRNRDPRFDPLLDRVRSLPDPHHRLETVNDTLTIAAPMLSRQPNVDLALGALTYVSGLPVGLPLFAVARVAGWTAHQLEELDEPPVRFRGLAN